MIATVYGFFGTDSKKGNAYSHPILLRISEFPLDDKIRSSEGEKSKYWNICRACLRNDPDLPAKWGWRRNQAGVAIYCMI